MPATYDPISLQRLSKLHPKLRFKAIEDYKFVFDTCAPHRVTYGLRTAEEQNWLYAQGRTRPGPIVTNVKAWGSLHQYGLAFDFCLLINGQMWSTKYDDPNDTDIKPEWIEIVEAYEKRGWESGMRWKSPYDPPHLQLTYGHTAKSLNEKRLKGQIKDGYVIIL